MRRSFFAIGIIALLAAPALAQDPYRIVINRPYWGYTWVRDPVADRIDAAGRFLINEQRAKYLREEVRQERLVTERKKIEHWDWERKFTMRANEVQRQLVRERELRRVADDPPPEDIYTGYALNRIQSELIKLAYSLTDGKSVSVEPDWLRHIHVACQNGNPALIKADKVFWPLPLLVRDDLSGERAQIEQLRVRIREAIRKGGDMPHKDIQALEGTLDRLQGQFKRELKSKDSGYRWEFGKYIDAQKSLKDLQDAVVAMQRPDAANYLKPLQGTTVVEVVHQMRGLTFARALTGDERYYSLLYYAYREEYKRLGGPPLLPSQP